LVLFYTRSAVWIVDQVKRLTFVYTRYHRLVDFHLEAPIVGMAITRNSVEVSSIMAPSVRIRRINDGTIKILIGRIFRIVDRAVN